MNIVYKDIKELPNDLLHDLFVSVGWSKNDEDDFKREHFNAPFKNSTIVISAWNGELLVGCVRVISDKIVRSVIEDLAVLPKYQNKGIGKELLNRCINTFPKSEWLVCIEEKNIEFYKSNGFSIHEGPFLSVKSKWF